METANANSSKITSGGPKKDSPACKAEGIRLVSDPTQEDWGSRQAMLPNIERARKEGGTVGFRVLVQAGMADP